MNKSLLVVLLLLFAFAMPQNLMMGVPSDQAFCAVSDGTYMYQGTNTDPAKIVKIRLSDLTRVAEYIVPIESNIGFLCPAAFDPTYTTMNFIAHRGGQFGQLVVLTIDTNFSTATFADLVVPTNVNYINEMFMDATHIYVTYSNNNLQATEILKIDTSTMQPTGTLRLPSDSFSGLVPDPSNVDSQIAVFLIPQVLRLSLSTFTILDQRDLPANLAIQDHTVSGDYLIIGDGSVVRRYSLSDLSADGELTTFAPNVIRFLCADPSNSNILHIDHRFPGLGPRDITPYPYQYIRATVEPFQFLDSNAYNISTTQINNPNFLTVFQGGQYFQYIANSDPLPYGLPILVKVQDQTETLTPQHQGIEYLTRADFINNSLLLASSASIIRKSVLNNTHEYVPLNGTVFTTYGKQPALFDANYGYYASTDGVVKILLSTLTMVEKKLVSGSTWTDASVQAGTNLYFYKLSTSGTGVSSISRFEYNTGASTPSTPLVDGENTHSLIYSCVADTTGDYLYCGSQTGSNGLLYVFRYNFLTQKIDMSLNLPNVYYIVAVALDNTRSYLVVTTDSATYKIATSTLTVETTLAKDGFFRLSAILFDKDNNLYLSAYSSTIAFTAYEVDLETFTLIGVFNSTRAEGGRVAYDSCTNSIYFMGSETFVMGAGDQPSNIAVIGPGGICGETPAPSIIIEDTPVATTLVPSALPVQEKIPTNTPTVETTATPAPTVPVSTPAGSISNEGNDNSRSSSSHASISLLTILLLLFVNM